MIGEESTGGSASPAVRAEAAVHGELRHLRATVVTLRDELDKVRLGETSRLQNAVSATHGELVQLQQTVDTLRRELERSRMSAREELDRALAHANDEIRQLRSTADVLRREFDAREQTFERRLHDLDHDWRNKLTEAEGTILALRHSLENPA